MREQKVKEYLSGIYLLSSYGPVRAAYVAREMNLSRPAVSVALKDLSAAGYLTIDNAHLIHLTEIGKSLAKEAMAETVRRGRSYHELVGHPSEEENDASSVSFRRPSLQHALNWLEKLSASAIPEAILILSRRYYCVRVIDIAQFLGRNSGTIRSKLRQLEHNGFVSIGEESVVTLTEFGKEIAETQYDRHASDRDRLIQQGQSPDEAERSVFLS